LFVKTEAIFHPKCLVFLFDTKEAIFQLVIPYIAYCPIF
jgi:hypothetical protein